jgi:hypothetical protein
MVILSLLFLALKYGDNLLCDNVQTLKTIILETVPAKCDTWIIFDYD